jgi:hypothetical protein
MKAKLELNGKEYEVEIGDEVVERIESKVWMPEVMETSYVINSNGEIGNYLPCNKYGTVEASYDGKYKMGFRFKKRKQAQKYVEWLKWIADVRRWNVANGNVGKKKYYLFIYKEKRVEVESFSGVEGGTLLFVSRILGNRFIAHFGKDKIYEMLKLQEEIMEMA